MFYEIVNGLCKERKTTITKMSEEIGLSNAAATSWKKGAIPKASTLQKISEYFGVSTDYLLGKTEIEKNIIRKEHELKYLRESLYGEKEKPADQKADRLEKAGYYNLTPENRAMIDSLIDSLLKSQSGE